MKKIILIWIFLILMGVNAFAYTFTRTVPSSIESGQQFTVTYTANDNSPEYFVSWRDTITGGCTPTYYENFMSKTSTDSETQTKTITFTSPSSGSCIFNGNFKFAGQEEQVLSEKIVLIEGYCLLTNSQSSYKCDNNSIYYFDNCGNKKVLKENCLNGCINEELKCLLDSERSLTEIFKREYYNIPIWAWILIVFVVILVLKKLS